MERVPTKASGVWTGWLECSSCERFHLVQESGSIEVEGTRAAQRSCFFLFQIAVSMSYDSLDGH